MKRDGGSAARGTGTARARTRTSGERPEGHPATQPPQAGPRRRGIVAPVAVAVAVLALAVGASAEQGPPGAAPVEGTSPAWPAHRPDGFEPALPARLAYPLDGFDRTGIRRLRAFQLVEEGTLGGRRLPPGALMPLEELRLRLVDRPALDVTAATPTDPELQAGLQRIFAGRDPRYSIAVLDITDLEAPRYAALDEGRGYLPGSVGKALVMTGLFGALAEAFPDTGARLGVLRETMVTADRFIRTDSHDVPIVDLDAAGGPSLEFREIRLGDRFSLFEWIDHAVSPSSNAAGSTSWKQAMLIRHFGAFYPPSPMQEEAFFTGTPKAELQELAVDVLDEPLRAAGLDTADLRQGTMFTRTAQSVVPGVASRATPRELLRWMVRLEQGRLVDRWSSLEMKRLLFYSKRRYRYAISPALDRAAVYFKSGSFYRCVPEEGFTCGQYRGNDTNIMNSVVIVENPASPAAGETQRVYLVAMMSNVLRRNSAEDHRDIGTEIDRLVASLHP